MKYDLYLKLPLHHYKIIGMKKINFNVIKQSTCALWIQYIINSILMFLPIETSCVRTMWSHSINFAFFISFAMWHLRSFSVTNLQTLFSWQVQSHVIVVSFFLHVYQTHGDRLYIFEHKAIHEHGDIIIQFPYPHLFQLFQLR